MNDSVKGSFLRNFYRKEFTIKVDLLLVITAVFDFPSNEMIRWPGQEIIGQFFESREQINDLPNETHSNAFFSLSIPICNV